MTIYFKTLKTLTLMFLLFSLLSIPSYILFYSGKVAEINNIYETKNIFSAFTLGNLG